ncbi:MAG: metal-dependent hydrolase [Algisphaera sp.]
MSKDRFIHFGMGLVVWGAFQMWQRRVGRSGATGLEKAEGAAEWAGLTLLPFVALGAWLPDWDLYVGGIGFHRSPLFHSVLPVLVLGFLLRGISRFALPVGLALGVASHLLWDIVQYGDVRWIRGGNADRLFLLVNAAVLLVYALSRRVVGEAESPVPEPISVPMSVPMSNKEST